MKTYDAGFVDELVETAETEIELIRRAIIVIAGSDSAMAEKEKAQALYRVVDYIDDNVLSVLSRIC